jgi:hypothetical protein
MKYSFILPYYKRHKEFELTLRSFSNLYNNRDDFEIIIIEDYKSHSDNILHNELLKVIAKFNFNFIHICYNRHPVYNPSEMFNIGVSRANGEYVILSNPEVLHQENILQYFDEMLILHPLNYIVCPCKAIKNVTNDLTFDEHIINNDFYQWYAHPIHRNRPYHFCSVLNKMQYININGFDEEYTKGIAAEDDDFIQNIKLNHIPIIFNSTPIVLHQEHHKDRIDTKLLTINRDYWYNTKKIIDITYP